VSVVEASLTDAYRGVAERSSGGGAAPVLRVAEEVDAVVDAQHRVVTVNSREDFNLFVQTPIGDEVGGEAMEARLDGLAEREGTSAAWTWVQFGDVVRQALQFHLGRRFRAARVHLGGVEAARGAIVVVPRLRYSLGTLGYERRAEVELSATRADGSTIRVTGRGSHSSAGHLGWGIPLMLAGGFFVTYPIVLVAFRSINLSNSELSVAEAIDDSCRQLAEALAAHHTVAAR
jgi:hypothetical protein